MGLLRMYLSDLVIIRDKIGVLEENNSVFFMLLNAQFAESIRTFITCKHYLFVFMVFHFAIRLICSPVMMMLLTVRLAILLRSTIHLDCLLATLMAGLIVFLRILLRRNLISLLTFLLLHCKINLKYNKTIQILV